MRAWWKERAKPLGRTAFVLPENWFCLYDQCLDKGCGHAGKRPPQKCPTFIRSLEKWIRFPSIEEDFSQAHAPIEGGDPLLDEL